MFLTKEFHQFQDINSVASKTQRSGKCRYLQDNELHTFHSSPGDLRVNVSWLQWAGYVERAGKHYKRMKFRIVFWDELPCKIIVDRRFRGTYCLHHQGSLMMEAVRTSETSLENYFTRQYIPEDNSELLIRRRENLKSHITSVHFRKSD
jgi:hypothetical protein